MGVENTIKDATERLSKRKEQLEDEIFKAVKGFLDETGLRVIRIVPMERITNEGEIEIYEVGTEVRLK